MWPALLLACTDPAGPAAPLECSATLDDDVPTVAVVSWEADGPSQVAFGPTPDLGHVSPVEEGSTHEIPLYGMPAGSTVYWRGETQGRESCEGEITTGDVPDDFFDVEITVDTPGRSSARWIVGGLFRFLDDIPQIGAWDRSTGQWVWAYVGNEGQISSDVQIAQGSTDLIFNQFDGAFTDDQGNLRRITLRGDTVWEWHTTLAHHMFEQLPDGRIAWQSLDQRPWTDPDSGETLDLIGDRVMELDPADGTVAEVFNVWDWLEPVENRHWEDLSIYQTGVDWTHGNALKYDADSDRYLLSLGHANVLLEFGRSDGQLVQAYGQEGLPVAEGDLPFDYQHDPGWTEEGTLLMFSTNPATESSGALEYEVRDGALHQVWAHGLPEGGERALALGQARRLDGGNTFINHGSAGVLREVTPDGEVVWEAVVQEGFGFSQVRLVEDWYPR